ncbi:MAG: hypothetical protein A2Y06_00775 [Omnitrophica WOR_2 bacterium GWA2_37_7]|nr:MAG: hypothetical protein A2Y06_00775 [Omnitrophica WOR_2 bacterium GWA2_37_7]
MSRKKKKHPSKKKHIINVKKGKWSESPMDLPRKVGLPSWVPLFNAAWKIALLCVVVFIIVKVKTYEEDKNSKVERAAYVEKLSPFEIAEWENRFNGGIKLIVFNNGKIKHTSIDSLNEELRFDWWEVAIKPIAPNQFTGTEAKIEIEIPHIMFEPSGIDDLTLKGEFRRRVGEKTVMTNQKGFEIVAELVEDRGNELILIFGFNSDKGL